MKAVWYERTGAASDVLVVGDQPKPVAGPGEVLIRLRASGVNPSDVKVRGGIRGGLSTMPYPRIIPHSDGAGIIEAVGASVSSVRIGQGVWVWNAQWQRAFGTAAQYVALPESQIAVLPDSVSFAVGASLGIPAVTAAHAILSGGDLEGRTVLVSGGAGTVGRLAVQCAKGRGASLVITTVGSDAEEEWAKRVDPDKVFRYTDEALAQKIMDATGGKGVDHAVEVEFGANVNTLAAVIKPRGSIVTYGSAAILKPEIPFYIFLFKGIRIEFMLAYLLNDQEHRAAAGLVVDLLKKGHLDVPVHHEYSLDECALAHQAVEAGGRNGSVIVKTI